MKHSSLMVLFSKMREREVSDEEFEILSNLISKHRDNCLQANMNRDLKYDFAVLMSIHPMKESKLKAFEKAKSNEKSGILSSYLISTAYKVGISKIYIEEYISLKRSWHFFNKKKKSVSIEEQSQMAKDLFGDNRKQGVEKVSDYIGILEKRTFVKNMLLSKTSNLIDMIIEKY